jgi:5'-3' exonuclease
VRNKRQREALEQHGEGARLEELVTIVTDLDLDVALEDLRYRGPDAGVGPEPLRELEFTSIVKDYMPPRKRST